MYITALFSSDCRRLPKPSPAVQGLFLPFFLLQGLCLLFFVAGTLPAFFLLQGLCLLFFWCPPCWAVLVVGPPAVPCPACVFFFKVFCVACFFSRSCANFAVLVVGPLCCLGVLFGHVLRLCSFSCWPLVLFFFVVAFPFMQFLLWTFCAVCFFRSCGMCAVLAVAPLCLLCALFGHVPLFFCPVCYFLQKLSRNRGNAGQCL